MNILVVGFGKMGMLHAATLKALRPRSQLIICDPSGIIGAGLSRFLPQAKFYNDLDRALESQKTDLAVVAAPNGAHFGIFQKLITHNIHMLVEKPFVTDFQEARLVHQRLMPAAEARRPIPKVMVGYCLRFVQTFEMAKDLLSKKALGRILSFEARMFSSDVERPQKGWRFCENQKGGGVLLDLGSHLVDLVRTFFGMPVHLSAVTQKRVSRHVEDHASAMFFYEGFEGMFEACWSIPGVRKPQAEISVKGTNGTLKVSNDEIVFFLNSSAGSFTAGEHRYDITGLVRPVGFDLAGPFYTDQMTEWLGAVDSDQPYRNTIAESVDNHRLIDLMKTSRGCRVELSQRGPE